ncbi:MAG: uridylate kinase [Clostridiales bacterium]|nr:uridylate kinase [Clostridiales bacterium]
MNGIELVIKIGSMALIRREDNDIDYNIFARLSSELRPGMLLVSSGATEIGRVDYMKRTGKTLDGDPEQNKTDYSAQGQAILMETYRRFVRPEYGVRQVLVEHNHFNDPQKRQHLNGLLQRAAQQGAIPIINYNDCVSDEENRKMELTTLQAQHPDTQVVECVDNDETAAVVAELVHTKQLILLTSTEGIYADPKDPATLVEEICASDAEGLEKEVRSWQNHCVGASRAGANGAGAKLEYALRSARTGVEVFIAHARHPIAKILSGEVKCTRIFIQK